MYRMTTLIYLLIERQKLLENANTTGVFKGMTRPYYQQRNKLLIHYMEKVDILQCTCISGDGHDGKDRRICFKEIPGLKILHVVWMRLQITIPPNGTIGMHVDHKLRLLFLATTKFSHFV